MTQHSREPLAFIDLAAQQARIGDRIRARIDAVLSHGQYILGPEVAEFETALQDFAGIEHAIGVANGTDALRLCLMTLGAGPGDAVFCPSFTFAATAGVVPPTGAAPVFVDIEAGSFNMDPASLARAIQAAKEQGLRPAGVIIVDLFGRPADYDALLPMAREAGLWVIVDAAQSFGATWRGQHTVTLGDMATTSFFPAKPLGCYGDGGAVFTNDPAKADLVKSLRFHGKGSDKYDNVRIGVNSRLDTLQAAILLEKLAVFGWEIEARNRVAARYTAGLGDVVEVPRIPNDLVSTWAQYTVTLRDGTDRVAVQAALKAQGVPSTVYYPRPLHGQSAFTNLRSSSEAVAQKGVLADPQGMAVSDALAGRVLSLPMHPDLTKVDQDRVIAAVRDALG
ncbi:MAG: DegT/DnrJ/EryC1/StrS family aminotransferase [Pseudomonadota bacterium]